MTEQEWLTSTYVGTMLEVLRGHPSNRKLRLLAVAALRALGDELSVDARTRNAIDVAERFTDGEATAAELTAAEAAARAARIEAEQRASESGSAVEAAEETVRLLSSACKAAWTALDKAKAASVWCASVVGLRELKRTGRSVFGAGDANDPIPLQAWRHCRNAWEAAEAAWRILQQFDSFRESARRARETSETAWQGVEAARVAWASLPPGGGVSIKLQAISSQLVLHVRPGEEEARGAWRAAQTTAEHASVAWTLAGEAASAAYSAAERRRWALRDAMDAAKAVAEGAPEACVLLAGDQYAWGGPRLDTLFDRMYYHVCKTRWRQPANLLRCVFGNPFRSVAVEASWLRWNAATVPRVAQAIYHERHFDQLPILADALEEAGCTDGDILAHCRQDQEHARGCWVVDLLLGKR
jgi:hypothetical protein